MGTEYWEVCTPYTLWWPEIIMLLAAFWFMGLGVGIYMGQSRPKKPKYDSVGRRIN